MNELPQRLKKLAGRGAERGAADVFAAAQADAANLPVPKRGVVLGMPTRRLTVVTAIAAAVMLFAGVAGAVRLNNNSSDTPSGPGGFAVGTTTSTGVAAGPTTTGAPLPKASKVYLASTRLASFNSCNSLASYAQAKATDTVGPYGLPGNFAGGGPVPLTARESAGFANDDKAADGAAGSNSPTAPPAQASTVGPDFSTTNVQEAGIDEPDSVKTDGKTIFTINNGKIYATSTGANPSLVGSIASQNAREMLLDGNRLIVMSDGGVYAVDTIASNSGGGAASSGVAQPDVARSSFAPGPYYPQPSRISVIDVSDPSHMQFKGSFDVEGSYLSARFVDGVARIVVRSYPKFPFLYPSDNSPQAQEAATAHNRDVVRSANADAWLPHFTVTDAAGNQIATHALASCGDTYRPPTFSGFGMLSVITFNTNNPGDSKATSVMADGEITYASPTRLYVATNAWDQVKPDATVQPSANTLIHEFDISDKTQAEYLVSGRTRGTVLNQFSLSEYDGVLRVATTDAGGGSESFLTVLKDEGGALQQIGQVGGLGKGEHIQAVRYIDKTAYVVTFRQVDPLYVVDIADATHPRVVGELPLTGYSAYLHPIGPGLLLGIGQEASTEGRRIGFQASLFDVSNPANPRLLARKVLEQGSSNAEFDHHAFLYWPATKLAVLPLNSYNADYTQSFQGMVGLHIGTSSIDEVGRVQPPNAQNTGGIERSIVIGNRVFAVSYGGVLVTSLDNLSQQAWVPYPNPNPDTYPPSGTVEPSPPIK